MTNTHPKLGNFVWESPTAPAAPPIISIVIGVGCIGLAIALSTAVVPLFTSASRTGDYAGPLVGVGLILLFAVPGAWMVIGGARPKKLPGIQFFEGGLEFGPPKKRQAIRYSALKDIRFQLVDQAAEDGAAKTRLVLSMLAGNPTGIGYAIGKLSANRIESFAVVVPADSPEFHVPILDGQTKRLIATIKSARLRT